MSTHLARKPDPVADDMDGSAPVAAPLNDNAAALDAAIGKARNRVAPVWPLKHFVAVNPFLGLTEQRFEAACATMRQVTGTDMLMPRSYYRDLIAEGRISDDDLSRAIAGSPSVGQAPRDVDALKRSIAIDASADGSAVSTVAEVLDSTLGTATAPFLVEDIAKWCAAYWDDGQAAWRMPWRSLPPYRAWRASAAIDRAPDVMGLKGYRRIVASLPEDPVAAIKGAVDALGLPAAALDGYLHRALSSIAGWAAYGRYLAWNKELYGEQDDTVVQLLAIRLAWDHALFALNKDPAFRTAWAEAAAGMGQTTGAAIMTRDTAVDTILQSAFEIAFQRDLVAKVVADKAGAAKTPARKPVQAAFCIDVRSEIFRRALETAAPEAETIGFAGFFGFPLEYVPIGHEHGGAQCPVLLTPKFVVREAVADTDDEEMSEILGLRLLRRRAAKAWKSFKSSAVSSFVYVETIGLAFAAKLIGDAAHITRTVAHPSVDGLDATVLDRVRPSLERGTLKGRQTGFTADERVDMAAAVLGAMMLTRDFARLVMLTGHGSTTVNNPHASGLDCGACGGHTGEANARVAAAILNDRGVRAGLVERGIVIPDDTWFLGCLHDTTTDEITIFDRNRIPASHREDLERLDTWLKTASARARAERSALLGINGTQGVDGKVIARSKDWSQVRPEWGLAGNAAFIAAPRDRTRGLDLGGRAFLHNYDWRQDEGWGVLELIMTAPMVVASWINLQYYGSTVNNRAFGCGNKVLHNVVGTLGVLEGNGGDLRTGLPWQSVHDGKRLVHEPLRLNVFIEAPLAEIERIINKHAAVAELVDNGWVHLFALTDEGRQCHRYTGGLQWQTPAMAA